MKRFSSLLISIFLFSNSSLAFSRIGVFYSNKANSVQQYPPLTLAKIKDLLKNRTPDSAVAIEIRRRGIDFIPSATILEQLRKLGAGGKTLKVLEEWSGSPRKDAKPAPTPSSSEKRHIPQISAALVDEGRFRIQQMDEVLDDAMAVQARCFEQLSAERAVDGACIRDYLEKAQIVAAAFELGGIYRPPAKDDATVWIGTRGYGVRHLPNQRTFKNTEFATKDMRDLMLDIPDVSPDSSASSKLNLMLDNLRKAAKFSETEVLADWFKRHQAQGEYQQKYGVAYRVYEVKVDDYAEPLSRVKKWLDRLNKGWQDFKRTPKAKQLG
jgi:hypothetical protein